MSSAFVSVIIPCYNEQQVLNETYGIANCRGEMTVRTGASFQGLPKLSLVARWQDEACNVVRSYCDGENLF